VPTPSDENVPQGDAVGGSNARPAKWHEQIWRNARRIVVFVIGSTVLLIGIIMVVAPGPAFVVIPLGLSILATEFAWARWLLKRSKEKLKQYTSIDLGNGD
jgi:uncharacterized protein (TIGR02611 family)